MRIGLIDVDGHNYPNLPLMKISAYHKAKGDHYDTTIEQDMYRIQLCRELNISPYPMIYDKEHADPIYRKIQRWCNNIVFWSVPRFEDYAYK